MRRFPPRSARQAMERSSPPAGGSRPNEDCHPGSSTGHAYQSGLSLGQRTHRWAARRAPRRRGFSWPHQRLRELRGPSVAVPRRGAVPEWSARRVSRGRAPTTGCPLATVRKTAETDAVGVAGGDREGLRRPWHYAAASCPGGHESWSQRARGNSGADDGSQISNGWPTGESRHGSLPSR